MKLSDKVAIVTGSGKGIGRAIAVAYAREGAKVVVTARTKSQIEDAAREIRDSVGEALAIRSDVSDEQSVARLVEQTIEAFGQVDILVNNAAVNHPPIDVVDMEPDVWRQVVDVNLTGAYLCARAVLPNMIERKTGNIINISSIGGRKGGKGRSAYRVTKAGLISLTETLAAETHQHGIRVNCICPGGVYTEMMDLITHGNPSPGLMAPSEIAEVAVFLASDESSAVTGTAIDSFGGTNPLFR